MAYGQVRRSIPRLDNEYNQLTDFGKNKNINLYFDIKNIIVNIEHYFDNEIGFMINKLNLCIKRKINNKINKHILNKIFTTDLSNKIIDEYIKQNDILNIEINIEYDTNNYPFEPPIWKLIKISNDGFINETENAFIYLINSHNEYLKCGWSPSIHLKSDLNYFLSKLLKFIEYI
jgi:hypothetical protein